MSEDTKKEQNSVVEVAQDEQESAKEEQTTAAEESVKQQEVVIDLSKEIYDVFGEVAKVKDSDKNYTFGHALTACVDVSPTEVLLGNSDMLFDLYRKIANLDEDGDHTFVMPYGLFVALLHYGKNSTNIHSYVVLQMLKNVEVRDVEKD